MIDTLDKNGKLALSKKQSGKLLRWARPDEFIANPNILEIIDCFSVKQTVVSDCSFVSSIIISAQYEKRFGKKIITKLIYPQNRKGNNVGLLYQNTRIKSPDLPYKENNLRFHNIIQYFRHVIGSFFHICSTIEGQLHT